MSSTPRVFTLKGPEPDREMIASAARLLRDGGLVAFPTETVYGLGADATNASALDRLNRVKGRPPGKPYSLHIHTISQLAPLVGSVSPAARALMERFWPGPLTVILPSKDGTTVGFRLPDHPVARALLEACDRPIVAPSANRAGAPPPTDAQAVLAGLDGTIDCLLDGGPTALGRESTVVEVADGQIVVRREGAIPADDILAAVR